MDGARVLNGIKWGRIKYGVWQLHTLLMDAFMGMGGRRRDLFELILLAGERSPCSSGYGIFASGYRLQHRSSGFRLGVSRFALLHWWSVGLSISSPLSAFILPYLIYRRSGFLGP